MSDKSNKKLVRVHMTYDDGTDEAISGPQAQDWLEWVNSYLLLQQARTGRADDRGAAFKWEPVTDAALADPIAEAAYLNRRLRALLVRADNDSESSLDAALDGLCRACGNEHGGVPCYCTRDD